MVDYNDLCQRYTDFVGAEQLYNTLTTEGEIDWYIDTVGGASHFGRSDIDNAAKNEPLQLKRILLLNAFDHISAMERAYALRAKNYSDYFSGRDDNFESDNKFMDNALGFFYKNVL